MPVIPATYRASLTIGGEHPARRLVDLLSEIFSEGEAAAAAFERADGRWAVTVHSAEPPNETSLREFVANAIGEEFARSMVFDTLDAKDWVKASLEDLAPVFAGRFVVHGRHHRARVPANMLGVEVEAALAFGTGPHGTTRGCLLVLDRLLKAHRPARVLDIGTGTGVLAIAAAKARKCAVLASDIDAAAVQLARENVRLNGVGNRTRAIHATGVSAPDFVACGPFDLVLANILANPLRELAQPMRRHLAPSAFVILSGLLPRQAPSVIAAYRARGLAPLRHLKIEGWSTLLLQLKS
jgi:ribosomal protein L11 methyltransferase